MKTTLCHKHGCYKRAVEGKLYCEEHSALENKPRHFANSTRTKSRQWHSLYASAAWRKTSREFLAENPCCARCGKPAKIADHIIPHRGDPALFNDKSNLQPMCWACHSRKTLEENNHFQERRKETQGNAPSADFSAERDI